ncbi:MULTISPECIES: LCP family protein [Streptomyces]|uniref:Transcriptional regulator n=1 Tax=Streptomyces spororaveus TaxID=284039 RepID=A0ABQ3THB8_9ACTN|nr:MULTISPECIES: LCP family protein [Streptomyces]MCM9079854.1 LCP family protein [Streptomyces spororaveus]MCX5305731.1 LCP family protein [Streptomyces sp. NBC_00160]GHI79805.1 transcriptional regulator [Streptomyces spororaveus]
MRHSSVRGEGANAQAAGEISGGVAGASGTVPPQRGGSGAARRAAGGPPRRQGRRRVLRWTASVLSLLILGTAAAGYLYYRHLNGSIQTDALNLGETKLGGSKPNAFGQTPLNILLIGSDARDDAANQALGGATDTFDGPPLADVQMLLHLSADRSNMSVVSMPRDTMLMMPKCTEPGGKVHPASKGLVQTNESLQRGGPGCTVATWQELTQIPIDHFMMIDFKGVVSMADAIGGVPVCVEENVHSRTRDGKGSGLKLPKGTSVIQGETALQWLRTRYGFEDGTDIGRTHAQHQYMTSMSREFRKNAKLTNPVKLNSLAQAAIEAMVVDPGLNKIDKLYDLSMELKKVPPGRITMTTMPWVYSTKPGLDGRVEPMAGEAEAVFRMVREDIALDGKGSGTPESGASPSPGVSAAPASPTAPTPPASTTAPAAAPAKIPVSVRNATSGKDGAETRVKNRANDVAALLSGKGFTKASADTQTGAEDTTVVRYATDAQAADAGAVATALGLPAASVQKSGEVPGITLFVGKDWRSGSAPTPPPPAPTVAPTSAHALNGDNEGACMAIQPGFTW